MIPALATVAWIEFDDAIDDWLELWFLAFQLATVNVCCRRSVAD